MGTALTFGLERALYPPSAGKGVFHGDDVLALKRVVSRAGFWPWQEFDDVYSGAFALGKNAPGEQGMAGWQKHLGIQSSGNYGVATHQAGLKDRVRPGLPHSGDRVWDQYSINLYRGFEDTTAAEKIVTDIFSWWQWMVAREPAIHYSQARPIQPLRDREDPPKIPSDLDCSGTVIYCAWLADALSPDISFGYSGNGWTGSLIAGGQWISVSDIDQMAREHYVLGFYGPSKWNTKHVTAFRSTRQIYSMGNEGAPEMYTSMSQGRQDFLGVKAYPVI